MDKLVLSFNDIPLLLVIFQCLLFALILLFADIGKRLANILLAGFLLALGLDAVDTLIYWSPSIKHVYLQGYVHIFYCLKFSVYVAAPLLFLYVRAAIHSDFKLRKWDLLHLIPLGIFPLFIAALYSTLTPEERLLGITQFGLLFKNPAFQFHLWMRHLLYVGYGGASMYTLIHYREELKQRFSNLEHIDMQWLMMLVGGFLMIWGWVFTSYLLTLMNYSMWLGNVIGIAGNIFSFVFVNALVLFGIAKANAGRRVVVEVEPAEVKETDAQYKQIVERINLLMQEKELFLDPELSLEELAAKAGLSARKISTAINRQCDQNFFDYINSFRVKRALEILNVKGMDANMLELMGDVGFNSKSTFYRAFKRVMNQTPTEYCDQLQGRS